MVDNTDTNEYLMENTTHDTTAHVGESDSTGKQSSLWKKTGSHDQTLHETKDTVIQCHCMNARNETYSLKDVQASYLEPSSRNCARIDAVTLQNMRISALLLSKNTAVGDRHIILVMGMQVDSLSPIDTMPLDDHNDRHNFVAHQWLREISGKTTHIDVDDNCDALVHVNMGRMVAHNDVLALHQFGEGHLTKGGHGDINNIDSSAPCPFKVEREHDHSLNFHNLFDQGQSKTPLTADCSKVDSDHSGHLLGKVIADSL